MILNLGGKNTKKQHQHSLAIYLSIIYYKIEIYKEITLTVGEKKRSRFKFFVSPIIYIFNAWKSN